MHKPVIAILWSAGILTLAGCDSDPAAQEPVQLQPGLYRVSYSGATSLPFPQTAHSSDTKEVCVSQADADTFPQSYPSRHWSALGASCDGPLAERVGNRVSGKVVCSAMDGASGNISANFDGVVSADSLDVRTKLKLTLEGLPADEIAKVDTSALDDLELRMSLQRVGDCPA